MQLDLRGCSLVKGIPTSIDRFPQGSTINLSDNKLSGELPYGIVRLASTVQAATIFDSLALMCSNFAITRPEKKVNYAKAHSFQVI